MKYFSQIAPYLTHPLVLIGFGLMLVFGVHRVLLRSHLLQPLSARSSSMVVRLVLHYGFLLAVLLIILGFGLAFFQGRRAPEAGHVPPVSHESKFPSFVIEAPARETSISGLPSKNILSINVVNKGAPAINTKLECFTVGEIELFYPDKNDLNSEEGRILQFDLRCGLPSYSGSNFDPNLLIPFDTIGSFEYTAHELPRLITSGRLEIILKSWFRVTYEDEAGGHHERFFKLYASRFPRENPEIKLIAPDEFSQNKDPSGEAWPCDWLQTDCSKTIHKMLLEAWAS
jgi:hypothetical protein